LVTCYWERRKERGRRNTDKAPLPKGKNWGGGGEKSGKKRREPAIVQGIGGEKKNLENQ